VSATGVAARLARREVRRRPWRSLVVVLLVALPVGLLAGFAIAARSLELSWEESYDRRWGSADVVLFGGLGSEPQAGPLAPDVDLPEGASVARVHSTWTRVRQEGGVRLGTTVTDVPLADPVTDGIVTGLRGRPPAAPGEVLLSDHVARRLGLSIGDHLVLDRPAPFQARVVGTAEWRVRLSEDVIALAPSPGGRLVQEVAWGAGPVSAVELVQLPDPPGPALVALARTGGAEARAVPLSRDSSQVAIVWSWVAGTVAFTALGVVIATAFTVTARRQLRLLGQLLLNGAGRRMLRTTLVLQGTALGLVGALAGVAVALGGTIALRPLIERVADERFAGLSPRSADLVPIVLVAVGTATLAALVPAWSITRISVVEALAGRRPLPPYPARLVIGGAGAAAVGLALLAAATIGATQEGAPLDGSTWLFVGIAVAGTVAILLGTCAGAPGVVARLSPLASSLRGVPRLAVRSIVRQRTRSGAVVAAVAVVAAGAVAGSTAFLTEEKRTRVPGSNELPADLVVVRAAGYHTGDAWAAPPPSVVDEVLSIVPGSRVVATQRAVVPDVAGAHAEPGTEPGPTIGELQVLDEETAAVWGFDRDVMDRLRSADVAVPEGWWPAAAGERVEVALDDRDGRTARRVGALVVAGVPEPSTTREAATRLGLLLTPGPTLVQAPSPLTQRQRNDLGWITADAELPTDEEGREVSVWVETSYERERVSRSLLLAWVVAVAALVSLAIIGLGLALSAAETKDERDVLATVGARPRSLRRLAATKAGVLAVTGTVLGVPVGFVPVWVVVRAATAERISSVEVVFPWWLVVLLTVAVPLVAAAATFLASAASLRLRPVRASTLAFD
jgi:putative ABC transport system permease protein